MSRGICGRRLLAALLAAGACGSALAAERPAWVDGESAEWPRTRFLTGVGIADERSVADSRARAELARVFLSRVEAVVSSVEFESTRTSNASSETRRGLDARDATQVSTSVEIEGATIAAHWTDPSSRRVHALAVLDRRAALASIQARLGEIDSRVEKVLAAAPPPGDRLGTALVLIQARDELRQRVPLSAQARVLDPEAASSSRLDPAGISTRAEAAFGSLRVALPARLDAEIEEGIRKGLLALGLRNLVSARAGADLEVVVTVERPAMEHVAPWFWIRVLVTGRIQEVGGGRVLSEFSSSVREGSLLPAKARARARSAIAASLEEAIAGSLVKAPAPAEQ